MGQKVSDIHVKLWSLDNITVRLLKVLNIVEPAEYTSSQSAGDTYCYLDSIATEVYKRITVKRNVIACNGLNNIPREIKQMPCYKSL